MRLAHNGLDSIATSRFRGGVLLNEMTAPATPAAGQVALYAKSDGLLYTKDDLGVETTFATSDHTHAFLENTGQVLGTLNTTYFATGSITCYRRNGWVFVMANTSLGSTLPTTLDGTRVGTTPLNYRPMLTIPFSGYFGGDTFLYMNIATNGDITVNDSHNETTTAAGDNLTCTVAFPAA
ncbi:hypothetical protein [Streptosporangium sp. G12]